MKTLCVDVRLWNATGIGTFLKNLLKQFQQTEELSLILLCDPAEKEELSLKGFSNLISLKSKLYTVMEQLELPLKIPSCDIFWTPHFNVPFLPIRAKKRLVTIHDVYHLDHLVQFSFPARKYAQVLYKSATKLADYVTTDSDFSFFQIQKHCSTFKAPLVSIPLGISRNFFDHYGEKKKEEMKKKYQLPAHFLMTIGNFKPHKNLLRLLEAFRALSASLELVLIGKKESVNEKRVHCISHVKEEDLPVIYQLAKGLVFPSLYEGFGFPPLEAMASGCPAIVSHAASLPEVCGEAVEYVDPYSVESIRKGMEVILTDTQRREKLIKKGKEQAMKFCWKKCAEAYLKIIYSL